MPPRLMLSLALATTARKSTRPTRCACWSCCAKFMSHGGRQTKVQSRDSEVEADMRPPSSPSGNLQYVCLRPKEVHSQHFTWQPLLELHRLTRSRKQLPRRQCADNMQMFSIEGGLFGVLLDTDCPVLCFSIILCA